MNCEKFKSEWLDYCKKIINSDKKCYRPIDCSSNDIHKLTCYAMTYYYKKICLKKSNFS